MEYDTILFSVEDAVATITLNRPEVLNASSPQMVRDLSRAADRVEGDETVKALVIRGAGRSFCAGADLNSLGASFEDFSVLEGFLKEVNSLLFHLEELPIPVIAVVHGHALAGGLELMLACDMVIAAEDARIGDQHVNFALMPGAGSSQRLPRKIGAQRAMELLLTGRWLSGKEAEQWGLVLRAVPAESLDEELERMVSRLRDKSRAALGWIKRTAMKGLGMSLRDGVTLETRSFAEYVATSTHPKEGIQAFQEKRPAKF